MQRKRGAKLPRCHGEAKTLGNGEALGIYTEVLIGLVDGSVSTGVCHTSLEDLSLDS